MATSTVKKTPKIVGKQGPKIGIGSKFRFDKGRNKQVLKLRIVGRPADNKKQPPMIVDRSDLAYLKWLYSLADEIYRQAAEIGWTWSQLATNSDTSPSTVDKLGDRITKYPRAHTLYKLANAVGMNVEAIQREEKKVAKAGRVA